MSARIADSPPPYDAVVFDCDSTLSSLEGIDELAALRPGAGARIAALTDAAMDGSVPLESVYGRRLELIGPTRAEVESVGRRYVETALPHAAELVAALAAAQKRVAIVSGGVRQAVEALAATLGVRDRDVHAVALRHDERGRYTGYDERSPLARSLGKRDVVAALAREERLERIALVGDGATDLEAADRVARFVAFGGVVRRAAVHAAASVSCDAPDLAALVPLLLAPNEIERLASDPRHATLLDAARPWLDRARR